MGRSPCCSKEGMNRGTWTSLEDRVLTAYIKAHGEGNWRNLPKRAGLKRCGKSCRLRWLNYLRPDIKRGNISRDEEDLILRLHRLLGNRWSVIARRLPGRTDNEIKNYWNTNLGKKARAQSSSSSSKPDKVTTQHQVIRTKATRCTRVVIPALKNQEDHSVSSTEMDQFEPEQCRYQEPSYAVKMDQYRPHHDHKEFHDLSFLSSYRSDGGAGADNNGMASMDAHNQVLLMEDSYFGDWAANSCPQDEISAGLDLESLAFLLDSSEWPLQENQS